jgi:hypothetical protein
VDDAFMLFQQHGWDIHALSTKPVQAGPGNTHHGNIPRTQEHQGQGRARPPKINFTETALCSNDTNAASTLYEQTELAMASASQRV